MIGVADTVLLVLMPGSGDSIQALKAGIMEIPDVIAINKMDHPAAKTMLSEVRSVLALDRDRAWKVPIVLTEAQRGENVPKLWERSRSTAPSSSGRGASRSAGAGTSPARSSRSRPRGARHISSGGRARPRAARLIDRVQAREVDPLTAVAEIIERVFGIDGRRSLTSSARASGSSTASRASRRCTARRRSRGSPAARCS